MDLLRIETRRMCVLATGTTPARKARMMTSTKMTTMRATPTARVRRVRTMPARDSRGRFVAGPRSEAPSWYVFSADAYRIPGETLPQPPVPAAPSAAPTPPRRTDSLERRRNRDLLHSALLMLIILVASGCYAAHLLAARPHLL
jgi:hypothetical protein